MRHVVRILIQARMGSHRLPGKSLADVAGQPLLARVVEGLNAAALRPGVPWQIVVATSTDSADEVIEQFCRERAVQCFRGSPQNVLERYVAATADLADEDIIVRATADNPLYCPRRARKIVDVHVDRGADYTCIENLSYVVPEVMRAGALRAMARRDDVDDPCREHVTPLFRRVGCPFYVVQLPPAWEGLRAAVRLTVDTPEDLARVRAIFDRLGDISPRDRPARVYQLWDQLSRDESAESQASGASHGPGRPTPSTLTTKNRRVHTRRSLRLSTP